MKKITESDLYREYVPVRLGCKKTCTDTGIKPSKPIGKTGEGHPFAVLLHGSLPKDEKLSLIHI